MKIRYFKTTGKNFWRSCQLGSTCKTKTCVEPSEHSLESKAMNISDLKVNFNSFCMWRELKRVLLESRGFPQQIHSNTLSRINLSYHFSAFGNDFTAFHSFSGTKK